MKVAIAGYGQEGEASYHYWRALGAELTILDEHEPARPLPEGVKVKTGPGALTDLSEYDLVVRTASLNPNKLRSAKKVWSATNEFFAQCPAPIIGVTGTKGKGTTASLIAEILKAAGKSVHLLGNIGVPALEVLPKITAADFVVFELSSFQLWDLEKSPETAVVLMIEPDHMDVHASIEEYVGAKANITTHQPESDIVIYHPTNQYSAEIAAKSAGKKIRYMTDEGAYSENDSILIKGIIICEKDKIGLIGTHNLENVCAAVTAAWEYTQDTAAIKSAVTSFKGLPHRLEFVGEVDSVKFYDDSQATGVGSTLAALRSFHVPVALILGGSDKGIDMSPLIEELDIDKHRVILIGQTSDKLEALLKQRVFSNYINLGVRVTMPEIVTEARGLLPHSGVVLLSPAHASFGMFRDYQDRGDQFKAAVASLL